MKFILSKIKINSIMIEYKNHKKIKIFIIDNVSFSNK